jgi:uncharacterized protein (TIGR03084 family)
MTDVAEVAADLEAEQLALDDVVSRLPPEDWGRPTPSPGWSIADQIGHLTYFDGAAVLAVTDPEAFRSSTRGLTAAGPAADERTLHRHLSASALLEEWRRNRRRLAAVGASLEDGARISWYGPSMSAKSFLTARLMECWAHGQDVVDAAGAERPATDRLRHVARLGYLTRGWSYANRGLEVPTRAVRLALVAPSGSVWLLGPDDAPDVVAGPALDFCLVVTQRRHVEDTHLEITGEAARDWLEKAQAFAGPATDGPTLRTA